MTRRLVLKLALAAAPAIAIGRLPALAAEAPITRAQVLAALARANAYWQRNNKPEQWPFWDVAAYHTGNMAAYALTRNEAWRAYSTAWAEHNQWRGAASDD